MKKIVLAVFALMFLYTAVSFAEQQYASNSTDVGIASKTNVVGATVSRSGQTVTIDVATNPDNYVFQSTVQASGSKTGVTTSVSQASNLDSAALAYGVIKFASGTAKTITIAAGVPGQMVTLVEEATVAITIDPRKYPLAPVARTGWNSIAITAANQSITLLWLDDTTGWVIVGNNGCTVS